jgi:MFS family permease
VLIVGMLSRLERPDLACGALVVVLLVARYVAGPVLTRSVDLPPLADWLIGVSGVEHVSYPLSPWLVYPLLGMIAGRWFAKATGDRLLQLGWMSGLGAAAAILLGISLWMVSQGRDLFRWGTVSASFFIFSLALLLVLSMLSVMLAKRTPTVAYSLALGGIASFALIPLHYALIGYGSLILTTRLPLAPWLVGALVLLLLFLCFGISKYFAKAMQRPAVAERRRWLYPLLLVAVVALAVFTLTVSASGPRQALLEAFLGQVAIAGLLAMRAPGPSGSASSSALRVGNSA